MAPIFTNNPSTPSYDVTYYNAVGGVSSLANATATFNAGQIVGKLELYINSAATGLAEKFDVSVTGAGSAYFFVEDGFIKTKVPSTAFFNNGVKINKPYLNIELKDAAGKVITTISNVDVVN